jgi:hypothetical protein
MLFKNYTHLLMTMILMLLCNVTNAQIDTTIKIDLLRGPSSPASSLLNISNTDIEKPTDVNAFMASVRNATNNFTILPKSFALDFAPYKIFNKNNHVDFKSLQEDKHKFQQSTIISLAVNNVEKNDSLPQSAKKTQLGIGFKINIFRGKLSDETNAAINAIYDLQAKLNTESKKDFGDNEELKKLSGEGISLTKRLIELKKENNPANNKEISRLESLQVLNKKSQLELMEAISESTEGKESTITALKTITNKASKIKLERFGFNLDFAGGTVVDFINNKFDNSYVTKAGGWLNGGWNFDKSSTSILFLARYLYNPKTAFADPNLQVENLHTFDVGGRFISTPMQKKLLLSGEVIYRSILNKANAASSWRLMFNAEYEVGVNRRLTFSFGRNFDGEIYKGGNVISALNFLVGFGKEKIRQDKTN